MKNVKNGPQSPAKEGAKITGLNNGQSRIHGRGSLAKDPMTLSSESRCKSKAKQMKTHSHERKCVQRLHIGTYNVRSLLSEDRLIELEEELKSIKWNIIGLAETRRRGEKIQKLESGNVLYTVGSDLKSQAGVGFLVHKEIAKNVIEFKSASERVAMTIAMTIDN